MKAIPHKQHKPLYEFGPFRLDTGERFLSRDGQVVTLTSKAFDTLVTLIENSGRVVEKDALMKSVWPDTFVEENTLTTNISTLRKALGQTNGEQYIETVPKRGYRFVANVNELQLDTTDLLVERHRRSRFVIREETEEQGSDARSIAKSLPVALFRLRGKTAALITVASLLIGLTATLVYVWTHGRSRPTVTHSVRSIAVLPFKSLGGQESDEYLGLGLADALITRIGNLKQIIVRPTTAMQRFASNDQDPMSAGRELGVEAVLAGRVQRSGERIRVTVQLINVSDGSTLWTEKFDAGFTDIFAVQDSISSQVAQAMLLRLTAEDRNLLARRYTENPEAHQLYLKGRYFWNKRTQPDFLKATEYFEQSINLDPNYALAYAGLADCHSFLNEAGDAAAAAEKALQIDEQLAEAHASLGNLRLFHDYDWPAAEREFRRSLELNPNYPTAHHWYAFYLAVMSRFDEAIAEIKLARELDPLSLAINTDVGQIFYFARQYDLAIAAYHKALEMDPNFINAHQGLGEAYARKGMHDEAIAELLKGESIRGERPEILAAFSEAYAGSGWNGFWQKVLTKERFAPDSNLSRNPLAQKRKTMAYVELGEIAYACDGLKKICEERLGEMTFLRVDPKYDRLRTDPRFAELLRQMKL